MADRPFFRIPPDTGQDSPWPVFNRLLATAPELAELKSILGDGLSMAFMMRSSEWTKGGRTILGQCHMPAVQGELRPLFAQLLEDTLGYEPTFLILLSDDWWAEQDARNREILVFHEALHAGQAVDRDGVPRMNSQTGLPIPTIRPHDVEEFTAVVERYGAWSPDLREFIAAADRGGTAAARVA
jgi:hypothetical protein